MPKLTTLKKKKSQNYCTVDMEPIRKDSDLSWKAKGLLIYLLDRPPNWKVNFTHLSKVSKEGKTALRTAVDELKKNGYLSIKKVRGKGGQIRKWEWNLTENPNRLPLQQESPDMENPEVENPSSGNNPPVLSTDVPSTEVNKTTNDNEEKNKNQQIADNVPYDEIRKEWNKVAERVNALPPVKKIRTKKRMRKLRARWKEDVFRENWLRIFKMLPHCQDWINSWYNNSERGKLTFNWIIEREDNYVKIYEDHYRDGRKQTRNDNLDHGWA